MYIQQLHLKSNFSENLLWSSRTSNGFAADIIRNRPFEIENGFSYNKLVLNCFNFYFYFYFSIFTSTFCTYRLIKYMQLFYLNITWFIKHKFFYRRPNNGHLMNINLNFNLKTCDSIEIASPVYTIFTWT